jgi:lysophospholipase L1-like esterase
MHIPFPSLSDDGSLTAAASSEVKTKQIWRRRCIAAIFGVTVSLCCGEVLAIVVVQFLDVRRESLTLDWEDALYVPHPYAVYTLRPGYRRSEYYNGTLSINALGFRGGELLTGADVRIATIGGSTTFCIRTCDGETYQDFLREELKASHPDMTWDVVNCGVGGYTTAESLALFQHRVLAIRPDIVVVYHGANDVHPRVVGGKFRSDYSHYRMPFTIPERGVMDLASDWLVSAQLLRKAAYPERGHIGGVTCRRLPSDVSREEQWLNFQKSSTEGFRRNMRALVSLAQSYGIEVIVVKFAFSQALLREDAGRDYRSYVTGIDEHNAIAKQIAEELRCTFVDCWDGLAADGVFVDCVHYSRDGNRVRAAALHNVIVDLVERRSAE